MPYSPLPDDRLVLWLSVLRKHGVGPKTFWKMYHEDPTFSQIKPIDVTNEIKSHQDAEYRFLGAFEDMFPKGLLSLNDCPPILSYAGSLRSLQTPIIAIVGARNASVGSLKIATHIAHVLTSHGYTIISGMARGIDGAAHEGALQALNENPNLLSSTIAVLAGGIDQVYPQEHHILYKKIRMMGCILSEMPFGTMPAAPLFPRRNRIIAGMCQGIILIEAAEKSGTIITAECALDLGKDVFVVPGSPLDPRSRGGNRLIKQGAILIDSAEDVLDFYKWPTYLTDDEDKKIKEKKDPLINSSFYAPLPESFSIQSEKSKSLNSWIDHLSVDPISFEEAFALAQRYDTNLTTSTFMAQLAALEMDGVLGRTMTGTIVRLY